MIASWFITFLYLATGVVFADLRRKRTGSNSDWLVPLWPAWLVVVTVLNAWESYDRWRAWAPHRKQVREDARRRKVLGMGVSKVLVVKK